MTNVSTHPAATIKVYHGYGHTHNLVVYGHVLHGKPFIRSRYSTNILSNIKHLVKIFFVNPIPGVKVRLLWENQQLEGITRFDGFFKFEWQSATEIDAGWHPVLVQLLNDRGEISATGEGKFFVPNSTQYAFISDIDDTVLISHSATIFKRLRVMFTKNPRNRKAFSDVVKHYHLLSEAHTTAAVPNPFFYVSSSEWNLYNDLKEFFRHNGLPEGVYLLNEIKKWHQLFKTGKTKHQGKLIRVARIMDAFPLQQFVLLGDNSQSDPEIYVSIAKKYPGKIYAIYIRNIDINNQLSAEQLLNSIPDKKIHTCLFKDNEEAIQHSIAIGLLVK